MPCRLHSVANQTTSQQMTCRLHSVANQITNQQKVLIAFKERNYSTNQIGLPNQQKLLIAFKERKYNEFSTLIKYPDINVDHFYRDPENGTLLDFVCRSSGNGGYASILILNGASIWLQNQVTGKYEVDEAITNSDPNTMQQLSMALRKQMTTSGTESVGKLMHTAVEKNDVAMMKFIANCFPRTTEYNPKSSHLELLEGSIEAVRVFIQYFDIDMQIHIDSQGYVRSCREIILQKYPELELELPVPSIGHLRNILFSYLRRGLTDLFLHRASEIDTDALNYRFKDSHADNDKTYLHLACEYNQLNVVQALLRRKVHLNQLARDSGDYKKKATPIMVAAFKGHYEIVNELLSIPKVELQIEGIGSVLHSVIRGMNTQPGPGDTHRMILKLLLDRGFLKSRRLNIDHLDNDNLTALHYAIPFENEFAISLLINAGANLYIRDCCMRFGCRYGEFFYQILKHKCTNRIGLFTIKLSV